MNIFSRAVRRHTAIVAVPALLSLSFTLIPIPETVHADHDPFGGAEQADVLVCHEDGGDYEPATVAIIQIGGDAGEPIIHGDHAGDIIPPYHWSGGIYPGQNWTTENEAIWNNNCEGLGGGTGTVTFLKSTDDPSGDAIEFEFTGDFGAFALFGDTIDEEVFADMNAGTYTVTETAIDGWTLDSVICDDGDFDTASGGSVEVVIEDGDDITCTLVNESDVPGGGTVGTGVLQIIKIVDGSNSTPDQFTYDVLKGAGVEINDANFEIDGVTNIELSTGAYTVIETSAATDFDVSYASSMTGSTDCNLLLVTPNATTTCTITNTFDDGTGGNTGDEGVLQIVKIVEGATTTPDQFTFDVLRNGVTLLHDDISFAANGTSTITLDTGSYTITENATTSFDATYANSVNANADCALITIAANATTTCVITNTYDDGTGGGGGGSRYTLTVEITGDDGEGTVSSDEEGIFCTNSPNVEGAEDCEQTYAAGTVVTLTADPDEDSNFDDSWTTGADNCTGNTTPCTVTMNRDIHLVAHFSDNQPSRGGGGGGGGGGSNNDDDDDDGRGGGSSPDPIVLGDQVSVIPIGGANAGGGGTAQNALIVPQMLFAFLLTTLTLRKLLRL